MSIPVSLATHAAVNGGTVHAQSNAGAIGTIVIYAVGFVAIMGMLAWSRHEDYKEVKKRGLKI